MNKQDELGLDDRALTALLLSEREGWRYADEQDKERERLAAELSTARQLAINNAEGAAQAVTRNAALLAELEALRADADMMLAALRKAVLALAHADAHAPGLYTEYYDAVSAALEARKGAA